MSHITLRALLVGERIDTAGLERSDVLSVNPLAFKSGRGQVLLQRYGVVVFSDLSPAEEDDLLRNLQSRIKGKIEGNEEETATVVIGENQEGPLTPGGPIGIRELSPEHLVVIADALAKSVALARDEKDIGKVFDDLEPLAQRLAQRGKAPWGRRKVLKHIGNTILVRQRVTGRVAVEEKPDVLWDRPELERLYSKLEDEYELKERAQTLNHKLSVISDAATALIDLIHTERSINLEIMIVALILFEIALSLYGLAKAI